MKLFNDCNLNIIEDTATINVEEIYSDINDMNLLDINITTAINEISKLGIANEHLVELDNLGLESKEISDIKNLLVANIYSNLGMRNVLVSQESIKETISKAVIAVKDFLINLYNKIVDFIKKIKKFIVDNCRKAYNKINKSFGGKEVVEKLLSDENRYKGDKNIVQNAIEEKDWKLLEELLNDKSIKDFPDLIKMVEDALRSGTEFELDVYYKWKSDIEKAYKNEDLEYLKELKDLKNVRKFKTLVELAETYIGRLEIGKKVNSNESLTENSKDKELIVGLINRYTLPILKTNYKFMDIAKDNTYVGSIANYLKVINIMNYNIVKETTSIINNTYTSGKPKEWLFDKDSNSLKEIEKSLDKIINLSSDELKTYLKNISSNKQYNFIQDKAAYGIITSYNGLLVLVESIKINDIVKYTVINFKVELSKPLVVDNTIKVIDDKSKNEVLKEIQTIETNSNWIIDNTDKAKKQLEDMTDKMNDITYSLNSNLFKTWSAILMHVNQSSFNNSILVTKLSNLVE